MNGPAVVLSGQTRDLAVWHPQAGLVTSERSEAKEVQSPRIVIERLHLNLPEAIEMLDQVREIVDMAGESSSVDSRPVSVDSLLSTSNPDEWRIVVWSGPSGVGWGCTDNISSLLGSLLNQAAIQLEEEMLLYASVEIPLTPEEIERRRQEQGGRTLEEIWKSLGRK